MMNNLGEEAEAFFRMGEDGTYEGGPASIAPLALPEEPAEVWDLSSTDEWLERRRRLTRLVATVIGGLSAGLVILSVCLLGASARSAQDARRTASSAPAPSPANASAPRPAKAPALPAPTTVAAQPETPMLPPETRSAPEPAPAPAPVPRVKRLTSVPRTTAAALRRASFDQHRPKAADILPRGGANLPAVAAPLTALHAPPTAVFPN